MKKHLSLITVRRSLRNSISLLIGIFFIFSLSGCFLFPTEEVVIAPPVKEPPKVTYSTVTAKKSNIEKLIEGYGNFVSTSQSNMFFKDRSGRIKKIYIKIGQNVKKGDLLAELDTDSLANQIKQQEIVVKKAQLNYDSLKSNKGKEIELAKLQLEDLNNQLEAALAAKESYSNDYISNLKGQIKKQEITVDIAKSSYTSNLQQSQEDLKLQQLQLDNLKLEMSKSKLIAPISGTIAYLNTLKEGDFIDAFVNLVSIADPTALQLQYPGEKANFFELGMKVKVTVSSQEYDGEVVMVPSSVPSDADEQLKQSVRINVKGLPKTVSVGDGANIKLTLEKKVNVIVLEKALLHTQGMRKFVQVLEDGVRRERDIETGIETATEVEIVKGLKEGEKVVKR